MYYYWSQSDIGSIPANTLIQAELAAAHVAQAAAVQAAMTRAAKERAKQLVRRPSAGPPSWRRFRANNDDYAAYAYATCVIPQQEMKRCIPEHNSSGQYD
ncbi:hypothetical protein FGIG_12533 [Fasciola gigantica]|uniref:Uncharacterized protein n=1 Tax=Fasciola gigantica TaxID=46835 RepID=A0A504Y7A8_FASGI|nr:hypothetical protein FGIG_12533 [Fasciola gigantica]